VKKIFFILFILLVANFVNAQTGIGTTTPVNKFEVVNATANPATSGATANGHLRLGATSGDHILDFGLSSSSTYSWLQARNKTAYGTYYNLVFNPNGGQVGIGTSSPSSTLTIGNATGTVGGEILLNPTSTQYEGGQIAIKKSLVGSTVDWTIDQYGTTSSDARLRFFSGTNEANGINILENGNVGLGTSAPTAKLNLYGGGIRIYSGFGNNASRPSLNTSSIGNYEIRGVGAGGGTAQADGANDGFLRLSAGGGANNNAQSSIDLSGYSANTDMNNNITMRTAGVERFRIDANGKIGLGTNTPGTSLHIENGNNFGTPANTTSPSIYVINNNNASSTANSTIAARTAGTGSGKPYFSLDVSGFSGYSVGINNPTDQLIINASWDFNTAAANNAIIINRNAQGRVIIPEKGGLYPTDWPIGWGGGLATYDFIAYGILGNAYNTRSDVRLKNTILNLDSISISKYLQLRPVSFFWNQDQYRETKLQYGFIAQEIEILFPEMVNTGTDNMHIKSVNYQALHALSLKVIQSQQVEIDALKKKQLDMEQRLLKLEAKLN
jgi:hypothetical protein